MILRASACLAAATASACSSRKCASGSRLPLWRPPCRAGKSTFFNRSTAGGAFAHEKLFATLSTRVERWELGGGNAVMLSDTVGFIRDLPHHLVASFKSTLEETVSAGLIIIVLDVSDPAAPAQLRTVEATLDEIGATGQPRVLALNKIDRLESGPEMLVWLNRHPDAFPISARGGTGIDALRDLVLRHMLGGVRRFDIGLALREGRAIDFLEKRAEVVDRQYHDDRVVLTARIGRRHLEKLLAQGATFTLDGRPAREIMAAWAQGDDAVGAPGSGAPAGTGSVAG